MKSDRFGRLPGTALLRLGKRNKGIMEWITWIVGQEVMERGKKQAGMSGKVRMVVGLL